MRYIPKVEADQLTDIFRTYNLIRDKAGRKVLEARVRRSFPSGLIDWKFGSVRAGVTFRNGAEEWLR